MIWRWATLAALGLYHGANPGMGWLFAVALGLQEKSIAQRAPATKPAADAIGARAVMRALPPIALGHAASVGITVAVLAAGHVGISWEHLKWVTAAVLIGFGVLKLVRPRHPRWVGMRVGFKDLTLWSFLMASAHGAGLMLLPVFLLGEGEAPCHGPSCHQAAGLTLTSWPGYLAAVGLHTGSMLFTAGGIALLVYYKFSVSLLRQAWFNLDRAWAAAMIVAGVVAVVW